MKVSEIKYEDLSNDIIDKVLFEGISDDGLEGECILVFGSKKAPQYRVPKAVELYKSGRAKKLLLSGGKQIEVEGSFISEAILMRDKALELGVLQDDLIIDTISQTCTKENILCSLIQLDRAIKLNMIHRILLVTSLYHMRRCYLTAKTYMPNWIDFSMCPASDTNTLRYNWFLSEHGIQRAKDEAYKISCYIREGSIPDFSI